MKTAIQKQPRRVSGPFTQAEMLEAKGRGLKATVFKPWKTGKLYPYASSRQRFRVWQGIRREQIPAEQLVGGSLYFVSV